MFSLAAGFKLYPALFGLLWIKERKYKDTLRLLLDGVLAFLPPLSFLAVSMGSSIILGLSQGT